MNAEGAPGASASAKEALAPREDAGEQAPGETPTVRNSLGRDIPAAVVVFLVAVPLCLGIALASGAPPLTGIIAGIAGGIVIPLISRSPLSVSGPAAGLAAIVATSIAKLGAFEALTVAVIIGGVIQIAAGALKLGKIASYVPSAVIKGMLAAIGILLILKQFPHAVGYDKEAVQKLSWGFLNSLEIVDAFAHVAGAVTPGAVLIAAVSLALLIVWERTPRLKKMTYLPAPLVVVLVAALGNIALASVAPNLAVKPEHLVSIPSSDGLLASLRAPNFAFLARPEVWATGATLAVVASLETLLNVEAIDKLDPYHRHSPPNRELVAQGAGNIVSGLLGGLPVTSVVVRSSAGLGAGGRTQATAFFHGVLMLVAVAFGAALLNRIPLASLAAILIATGYKLTKPEIFRAMRALGNSQLVPFLATVVAIVITDLLVGILIGMLVSFIFSLRKTLETAVHVAHGEDAVTIHLTKEAHFYVRPKLIEALRNVPAGKRVIVDIQAAPFLDHDVEDAIASFKKSAKARNIDVEVRGQSPDSRRPVKSGTDRPNLGPGVDAGARTY